MFNPFKRKRKSEQPIVLHDISELWKRKLSWREEVYWSTYRFFKYTKIFHPTQMYREVKWFIQRGRRGWATCDTWSLDYYLNNVLIGALTHLRECKHGIPITMFGEVDGVDDIGNPTDTSSRIAEARWNQALDKMVESFKASKRILDGLYEEELGEYPLLPSEGQSQEEFKQLAKIRMDMSKKLAKRDEQKRQEGMKLFVEHYHSLWD